jgi:thioredoxin-related protein
MRTTRAYFLIAVLAAVIGLTLMAVADDSKDESKSSDAPTEIEWVPLDTGLTLAGADNKHVFVNFTTSWCGYCKKMNRTTFADPEVIQKMYDDFVAVKVDGDSRDTLEIDGYKITERNLARAEFGVRSYPTYWFLSPEGEKLGRIKGYQFKPQLMEYLAFVAERRYDTTGSDQEKADKGGGEKDR